MAYAWLEGVAFWTIVSILRKKYFHLTGLVNLRVETNAVALLENHTSQNVTTTSIQSRHHNVAVGNRDVSQTVVSSR